MHLTSELALDFIDGRLTTDQESLWQRHLEICDDCAKDVRDWRQLRMDLKRSHLMSAPDHDLKTVIQIFPPRVTEDSTVRSILAERNERPYESTTLALDVLVDLRPRFSGECCLQSHHR